jgi:streptomycin 6-kinase
MAVHARCSIHFGSASYIERALEAEAADRRHSLVGNEAHNNVMKQTPAGWKVIDVLSAG